ncbi:MAG: dicarboxylate/amino acid:cation symporter [Lachnospiraceae bacterium]|nr:dicarboxylate/amino acid:cation symporter [Lachnospiraceae bacterium]
MSTILKKIRDNFALTLLISVVVGLALGFLLGDKAQMLAPIGTVFTRLLKMMVPILVLFSIASAFANIADAKKLARFGGKTILWFLCTTTIASVIGIVMGLIFKPGMGMKISGEAVEAVSVSVDDYIAWLPENFVGCISEGNTVQIVFLAIFIGIAVVCMKNQTAKEHLKTFLNTGMELVLTLIQGIMYIAPLGVAALTATSVASMKGALVSSMGSFLAAYSIAFVLQVVVCYFGLLRVVGKVNPFRFTRKLLPALITAFTSTSSAATLPLTMQCVKDMGVNDEVADFGVPLGCTFNMDSMGLEIPLYIMLGMYAVGQNPSIGNLVMFVLFGIAFSVGCAGVPGGGLAIAVILINAFGLPTQVVAMFSAVFFYLDCTGTAMNIWGDAACSVIVARTEGQFDDAKFNAS